MICNECSTENKDDALYCANCGEKLEAPETAEHGKKCPECGFDNPAEGKFCARCGNELRRRHNRDRHRKQSHQEHQKKKERRVDTKLKWHPGLVAFVLLVGVFIFIGGMELFVKKQPAPLPQIVEIRTSDANLEATAMEIASKFICSCGTCGEKPLDTCTCNRAVEERQFIRSYLEQGQKPEQVIVALNNTYGWVKPEFATLVGDSTASSVAAVRNNFTKSNPETSLPLGTFGNIGGNTKPATPADRQEIFSHFKCPCGQCGIDELKDCGCQHPRGATEVKSFVDARIAEGKYTIAQLMDAVDAKYGGRKF